MACWFCSFAIRCSLVSVGFTKEKHHDAHSTVSSKLPGPEVVPKLPSNMTQMLFINCLAQSSGWVQFWTVLRKAGGLGSWRVEFLERVSFFFRFWSMWVASGAGRLNLGSVASTTHHPGGDVCETLTKSPLRSASWYMLLAKKKNS